MQFRRVMMHGRSLESTKRSVTVAGGIAENYSNFFMGRGGIQSLLRALYCKYFFYIHVQPLPPPPPPKKKNIVMFWGWCFPHWEDPFWLVDNFEIFLVCADWATQAVHQNRNIHKGVEKIIKILIDVYLCSCLAAVRWSGCYRYITSRWLAAQHNNLKTRGIDI